MKKIFQLAFLLFLTSASFAQYKKASFFTKSGRTFELGTRQMIMSNGGGKLTNGFIFTQSLESDKKNTLYGDFMGIMPFKYSYFANYTQSGSGTINEKLSGKAPFHLYFCYGMQHRFTQAGNGSDKGVITPDVRIGLFGTIILGSNSTLTRPNGSPVNGYGFNPEVIEDGSYIGLELSGGATYYFSEKLGIRGSVGYYPSMNADKISGSIYGTSGNPVFSPYKSHPAITFTLKYRVNLEGE